MDLRPKSVILTNSQHTAVRKLSAKLPPTATLLMQEAKEEIIRLENIIAEQQSMLNTLLGSLPDSDSVEQVPKTSHQISYQLTTTTTATASLTQSDTRLKPVGGNRKNGKDEKENEGRKGERRENHSNNFMMESFDPSSYSSSNDLWTRYQQLMFRQESSSKLSGEVRTLIESLHQALTEKRTEVAQLRAELGAKQDLSLGK